MENITNQINRSSVKEDLSIPINQEFHKEGSLHKETQKINQDIHHLEKSQRNALISISQEAENEQLMTQEKLATKYKQQESNPKQRTTCKIKKKKTKNKEKQLEENTSLIKREEERKENQMFKEKKLSIDKKSVQDQSFSKQNKNNRFQKPSHYLSPSQIIAEVRNQQEIIDQKFNRMSEQNINHDVKAKVRPKLISIKTRQNERQIDFENEKCMEAESKNCLDILKKQTKIKKNTVLPPLK